MQKIDKIVRDMQNHLSISVQSEVKRFFFVVVAVAEWKILNYKRFAVT